MPVRSSFTAGEVLTAADLTDTFASKVDYALTANAQSGTGASAYTFVLADASRLTTATGTSAKTFTIPPQANVAWVANSIIRVANYGTGDLTIAGGSGVTVTNASKTLAQYESAALVRTGSNAWTLIPFSGGAGNADFSDAADGTYTDGGVTWKWKRYTASGTLTITRAGLADVLVVGGGGGGGVGDSFTNNGGGGGAGAFYGGTTWSTSYLPAGTHRVVIGAGGAQGTKGNDSSLSVYLAEGGGLGRNVYGGGGDGGSGGGASGSSGGGGGGLGRTSLGNNGFGPNAGGGGGGGGGAGGPGSYNPANNQSLGGGAGLSNSITGTAVTYAAGGGSGNGGAGTVNTGNGGGGGNGNSGGAGGAGGSGVVIVRVKV